MQVLLGDAQAGRAVHGDIGFAVAAGFVTGGGGLFGGHLAVSAGKGGRSVIVLGVVIIGFAAVVQDSLAALVTAGLAWPFYLGFLVDRYGELHWHGRIDLLGLAGLAGLAVAALIGTVLGRRATDGRWATDGRSARPGPEVPVPATEMPGSGTRRCAQPRHVGRERCVVGVGVYPNATAVPDSTGRGVERHG